MFLKSLTISGGSEVIRAINFRNGINLIVDETPTYQGTETGNNVGKTTVLMLIDFCLGANQRQIYTDPENKKKCTSWSRISLSKKRFLSLSS